MKGSRLSRGRPCGGSLGGASPRHRAAYSIVLALIVGVGAVVGGCSRPRAARGGSGAPAEPAARPAGAYLRALGTAQDGGLPQTGCSCERCDRARRDPAFARRVASLAVVLPASRKVFLIDATPDLPEQVAALADVRDAPAGAADRSPVDGVLLTHAHIGHYLGLAHLGFEAVNTHDTPVWCTPRMAAFLRANGPWSQLVSLGNVALHEVAPAAIGGEGAGGRAELGDGVVAEALAVPHRDEYSDTVAWRLSGPNRAVLYVPDVDGWEEWGGLESALRGVDVAIVDGTFYSDHELGDRDVSKIGHPRITESLARFGEAVRAGRLEVAFTHLNHSNPALDPDGPERAAIDQAGFRVLDDGEEIEL